MNHPTRNRPSIETRFFWCNNHLLFCLLLASSNLLAVPQPPAPLRMSEMAATNGNGFLDGDGDPSDWIELHNFGDTSLDLEGFFLTDKADNLTKWSFPQWIIPPQTYRVLYLSGKRNPSETPAPYLDARGNLHVPFQLRSEGEYLGLVSPDTQTIVDQFSPAYPKQYPDLTYGWWQNSFSYFTQPTPGEANRGPLPGVVSDTQFSHDRGFYQVPIQVAISTDTPGATIRFTVDGSTPTETHGTIYTQPVSISRTTPLRAFAYKAGFRPTNVDTHTYLFLPDVLLQSSQPEAYPSDWGFDNEIDGIVVSDYEMDPRVVLSTQPGYSVEEALLDLPTLSLTLPIDDFVGPETGIYSHPLSRGSSWERECSLEWIPNLISQKDFQLNCKIEIHGNSSRRPFRMQKHSFRLTFTSQYGPPKLSYPLFPDSPVDEFNQLVLRACFTDSWGLVSWAPSRYRPNDSQYLRDAWMKESMRDMGHPSSATDFAHLYVNGLYWGLYNIAERINPDFFVEHQGGAESDWEIVEDFGSNPPGWATLLGLARQGLQSDANYSAIPQYLDIDNFIDYMILHFYGDAEDWPHHNGYAARNAALNQPFQFYVWDQEIVLDNPNIRKYDNNTTGTPGELFQALRQNESFRQRFADRVQRHLYQSGGLTLAQSQARYRKLAQRIDKAIVAESARWGDTQRSTPYGNTIQQPSPLNNVDHLNYPPAPNGPDFYFTREDSWLPEQEVILNHYLPRIYDSSNPSSLVAELRSANLFPSIDAPVAAPKGGHFTPPANLTLASPSGGEIYYTLDGSDPSGGKPATTLLDTQVLLNESALLSYRVPSDNSLGLEWTREGFSPIGWNRGRLALGFESTPENYRDLIQTDVIEMRNVTASVYLRIPFDIPESLDLSALNRLLLDVRVDDGLALFLNAQRIPGINDPATLTWNSAATANRPDATAVLFQTIDLSEHIPLLKPGANLLAVQGLNAQANSSDLLVGLRLTAQWIQIETPPNEAIRYQAPISLNTHLALKSRALLNGEWSALTEVHLLAAIPATPENLSLSEFHYHPDGDGAQEFLELYNLHPSLALDLSHLTFTHGIQFTFPIGSLLEPRQAGVLVRNLEAFQSIYGTNPLILGEYSGALDNSSETLRLADANGTTFFGFLYQDRAPWPLLADGAGYSLERLNPTLLNADLGNADSWKLSSVLGGTPGRVALNPGFSGNPTADLDGDGLIALLEFYLGSSDTDPSSGSNLISFSFEPDPETQQRHFLLRHAINPLATEVQFLPECSTNLQDWKPAIPNYLSPPTAIDYQGQMGFEYRSQLSEQEQPQLYLRFRLLLP